VSNSLIEMKLCLSSVGVQANPVIAKLSPFIMIVDS